jgi:hypothetical protein
MSGRRWRIHNRKIKYFNTPIIITLNNLDGLSHDIEIIPSNNQNNHMGIILKKFEKEDEYNLMVRLINNNKVLDDMKSFYVQNVYKPQTLTIIFMKYNLEQPKLFFIPEEQSRIEFQEKLNNIQYLLRQDIIPDDIYIKATELFEYARSEMNFVWFNQDKHNYISECYNSRFGGTYRYYCIRCYEGCPFVNHNCDNDALRLAIIIPLLTKAIDNCCSNFYLFE